MGVNEMLRRAVGGCFTDVDFAGVGARGGRGGRAQSVWLTTPPELRPEARRRKTAGRRAVASWRPPTDGRGRRLHAVVSRRIQ